MTEADYLRKTWGLLLLYPLAAFLVLLSSRAAGSPLHAFRRDWPYALGGPVGALSWWLVAAASHTWMAILVGYLVGVAACLSVVFALNWVSSQIARNFD